MTHEPGSAPGEELEAPEENQSPVRVNAETKTIPALLVVDTSISMQHCLADVRAALEEFIAQLRREPLTAEFVRLSIVTFGGDAGCELPMSSIADPATTLSNLAVRHGGTNYTEGFTQAHEALASGLSGLRATGDAVRVRIQRPNMFVVTDGQPNRGGPWQGALQHIRDEKWRRNVFAFGFGDVERHVITEIADEGLAYFAADGQTPMAVFTGILKVILASLVSLSAAAGSGAGAMAPPAVDPATHGLIKLDSISL